MKLTEIFEKKQYSLSFEVFPPKTDDVYDSVKTATEEIAALKPAFMSVTYGAGGGIHPLTTASADRHNAVFTCKSLIFTNYRISVIVFLDTLSGVIKEKVNLVF